MKDLCGFWNHHCPYEFTDEALNGETFEALNQSQTFVPQEVHS